MAPGSGGPSGRDAMLAVLRRHLGPVLRDAGFTGSLPHMRRERGDRHDLVSIQFDKYGGGFVVELGRADRQYATALLRDLQAKRLTSFLLPGELRGRLQKRPTVWSDGWFRYDRAGPWYRLWTGRLPEADQQENAAREVLSLLPQAEAWFQEGDAGPNVIRLG